MFKYWLFLNPLVAIGCLFALWKVRHGVQYSIQAAMIHILFIGLVNLIIFLLAPFMIYAMVSLPFWMVCGTIIKTFKWKNDITIPNIFWGGLMGLLWWFGNMALGIILTSV